MKRRINSDRLLSLGRQSPSKNQIMKHDLFRFLPLEILSDILLRLSLQTIATCKCVCKPWLNLIESADFLKSHLSKSTPALVVSMPATDSNWFNVFKLEDELKHKHDPITKFDFPQASTIYGSANGLLLLKNPFIDHLYVCNPITREFVEIRGPRTRPEGDCYGFGVSRISGQYKVVHLNPRYGCHVYTLGTGSSWRSVEAASPSFNCCDDPVGAFVNGNLHWLVTERSLKMPNNKRSFICCFDVETERFSTFSPPGRYGKLHALGDCLCFVEEKYGLAIWLFEEYKCWRNAYVALQDYPFLLYYADASDYLRPIKIYRNRDMLILWNKNIFLYYSNKKKSVREIGLFGKMDDDCYYINSIHLTPRLLSLNRNLGMENVMTF